MYKLRKIVAIAFSSLIHFSHLKVILRNIFFLRNPGYSDEKHLTATMIWLKRSQDEAKDGGCSGIYTFMSGWKPPYPETTGYIIPTFLNYSDLTSDTDYLERAKIMGDWEIRIQLPSGAIRGGVGINDYPIVFNTGQVIFGWVALYEKTVDIKYLEAARRAADWLVSIQDSDGSWYKFTFNNVPHAYNSRVAWALMELYKITKDDKYRTAAENNARWVLLNSSPNGWFNHMGFNKEPEPWTHTIVYTLRGLFECSFFTDEELRAEIINKVCKASEQMIAKYSSLQKGKGRRRFLPGTFNQNWHTNATYSCLTGNAQFAILLIKLYNFTKEKLYLDTALRIIDDLKSTQDLSTRNNGIRGGIAGSYPIWGKYVNFGYPNWAAKFFADALMLKMKLQ